MKLCLIGNSHLAAMKLGWDQLVQMADPAVDGLSLTFYGAPRDMLKGVEVRDGKLVPGNQSLRDQFVAISGTDTLDPRDFDAFLLVGLGASFKRVLRLYNDCRWQGVTAHPDAALISTDMAHDILVEGYASSRLLDIGHKLAGLTTRPIFALHEPLWSPRTSPCPNDRDFGWLAAADGNDGAQLADLFRRALQTVAAPRLHLLMQPDSTIDEAIMTRPEFNRDADKDISGAGGGRDAAHMNADYGIALWRHHLDAIRAPAPLAQARLT